MTAFHWQDNLSSTAFTPRDFQVELLAEASEQNIIICLGHNSSKEFIALKLILQKSIALRTHTNDSQHKVTIVLTATPTGGESLYNLIFHLTDLKVINCNGNSNEIDHWPSLLSSYQVIILNIAKCLNAAIVQSIDFTLVNLIIIEECHKNYSDHELVKLFEYIRRCEPVPTILGLAGPLHSAGCSTDQLAFHVEVLEKTLQCRVETASDIVTVLRYAL